MAVCRFSFSTVSTFEDRIFPHSTGLRPLPGPLPCYLRNHQRQLTNNNSEAGQGYCCPYDASWRLVSILPCGLGSLCNLLHDCQSNLSILAFPYLLYIPRAYAALHTEGRLRQWLCIHKNCDQTSDT